MINVSAEFKELMQERTDFRNYAEITFADGTELPLSAEDFEIDGNTLVDGAGAKSLPLGAAICRTIQISLKNEDDHLSGYDFFGAKIRLYLTFELSATTERIELGTFTVIDPESYGETVTVTASDDMYKADKPYETGLTFPAALSAMFQDACTRCGIPYTTTSFKNAGFVVENLPAGEYTFREMFGFMAMIAGGNARVSRLGYMEILTYDFWPEAAAHRLADWSELTVATDDIFVTGVQTVVTDTDEGGNETLHPVLHGTEGYVLDLENPLFEGKEAEALALIGGAVVGATFRKFDGEYIGYPIAEFMDTVTITDRKGNVYNSVITDIEFEFGGFTSISNSAESAVRNSSKYISSATKSLVAARKMMQAERTAREAAIDHLNKMLAESSGLYTTEEEQEDGSVIYYLHDKPTIAESQNVMKLTSEAIGLSQDGGKTYPFGFTVTGEMVMSIIRAEGIEADWVRFGSKTVTEVISETQKAAVSNVSELYYLSTSDTELVGGEWLTTAPNREMGCYIWKKTITTYGDGTLSESKPVCLSGTQGEKGEDAVTLRIDSSRGTVFKNNTVETVLTVSIYYGSQRITDRAGLVAAFGTGAYLEWSWQRMGEDSFGVISASDSRLRDDAFSFHLSAADVDSKVVFMCKLIT